MTDFPPDTIKPSRLNRRRKKKWRVQELTSTILVAILCLHSQKTSVGICSTRNQGDPTRYNSVPDLAPMDGGY